MFYNLTFLYPFKKLSQPKPGFKTGLSDVNADLFLLIIHMETMTRLFVQYAIVAVSSLSASLFDKQNNGPLHQTHAVLPCSMQILWLCLKRRFIDMSRPRPCWAKHLVPLTELLNEGTGLRLSSCAGVRMAGLGLFSWSRDVSAAPARVRLRQKDNIKMLLRWQC